MSVIFPIRFPNIQPNCLYFSTFSPILPQLIYVHPFAAPSKGVKYLIQSRRFLDVIFFTYF